MTSHSPLRTPHATNAEPPSTETILSSITADSFATWYRKRTFRQNIENGTPYFNGPGTIPDPTRHQPSALLQCHRRIAYRQLNAPEEQPDPTGIFWIGSRVEEELAVPYLRDTVTDETTFVTNSLWVDFEIDTDTGPLHIKGATDPVIVDSASEPLVLTEIKTKKSVEHLETPNQHHKAQAHAYLFGLSEKSDRQVTDAVILYVGRNDLTINPFRIEFDPEFWASQVVDWAQTHTEYRLNDQLPPAEPKYDWECKYCDYKHRCGEADTNYRDIGPEGLLPGFSNYPRTKIIDYLESRATAQLTPTLAHTFPDLAEQYDVADWRCASCDSMFKWNSIEWTPDNADPPFCPACIADDRLVRLHGPDPSKQTSPDQMDE